jgi:hypothetical protein
MVTLTVAVVAIATIATIATMAAVLMAEKERKTQSALSVAIMWILITI